MKINFILFEYCVFLYKIPFCWWIYAYYIYVIYFWLLFIANWIKQQKFINNSQTIRKLKPKKSPRTPPQSATRESKEKANSSFRTRILSLVKDTLKSVVLKLWYFISGFPFTWNNEDLSESVSHLSPYTQWRNMVAGILSSLWFHGCR